MTATRGTILITLAAFGASLLAAGAEPARPDNFPTRRPNIVFVVADTLRRDHVGVYGDQPTPFLDSLAARATVFDRAYAQSAWTNPSVASMFTSRYQSQHHVVSFASVLSKNEQTLAEVLSAEGYATGGFTGNVLVQSARGFAQGFDEFLAIGPGKASEAPKGVAKNVTQKAFDWIDSLAGRDQPVFLYLQYMETHIPYELPESLLLQAFPNGSVPDVAAINAALRARSSALTADELTVAKILYRLAVIDLDEQLRLLFAGLEERGILRDSVFVFTADHGEEFAEHSWFGHGMSLYNDAILVPLLIGKPGQATREDVTENVALIDVAPTLLELASVSSPATFEGRSLARIRRSNPDSIEQRWFDLVSWFRDDDLPVASELLPSADISRWSDHTRTILLGTRKLIRDSKSHSEYYDLRPDPAEKSAARSFDEIPLSMQYAFDKFIRHVFTGPSSDLAPEIDTKTRERMRALGYAE